MKVALQAPAHIACVTVQYFNYKYTDIIPSSRSVARSRESRVASRGEKVRLFCYTGRAILYMGMRRRSNVEGCEKKGKRRRKMEGPMMVGRHTYRYLTVRLFVSEEKQFPRVRAYVFRWAKKKISLQYEYAFLQCSLFRESLTSTQRTVTTVDYTRKIKIPTHHPL